jgi:predicted AAA+ superfamily ATPase
MRNLIPDLSKTNQLYNMINLQAERRLRKLAKNFRSVGVVGPRQSVKTTLCGLVFPEKKYVSRGNPDTLDFANVGPRGFLSLHKNGAILDQIQRAPHLFSYTQQMLDEIKKKGLFIVHGID